MDRHRHALDTMMSALIAEWGLKAVVGWLAQYDAHTDSSRTQNLSLRSSKSGGLHFLQMVDDLVIPMDVKVSVKEFVNLYNSKAVLPNLDDIKHLLMVAGGRPPTIKSRVDGLRKILEIFQRSEPKVVLQLIEVGKRTTVSRLGPLIEAIASVGDRIDRRPFTPDAGSSDELKPTGQEDKLSEKLPGHTLKTPD